MKPLYSFSRYPIHESTKGTKENLKITKEEWSIKITSPPSPEGEEEEVMTRFI
jgi:hypothetical protein